jgi:hypothetical protein
MQRNGTGSEPTLRRRRSDRRRRTLRSPEQIVCEPFFISKTQLKK